MIKNLFNTLLMSSLLVCSSFATVVTFTGGTAYDGSGNIIGVTSNQSSFYGVKSYIEGDFELTYVVGEGGNYGSQTVGNYYGSGDVIHGHWIGGLTSIDIVRTNGAAFDLQYLALTSNTSQGGGPHTDNETIYIQGYYQGTVVTPQFMLPGEDWGNTYQDIIFPESFNLVDFVTITGSGAFCYGMDNFVFDEPIPQGILAGNWDPNLLTETTPVIPEASSGIIGLLGTILLLRRRR